MMTTSMHTPGLNTETAMVLSQSMNSVNTSPDEEVGVAFLSSRFAATVLSLILVGVPRPTYGMPTRRCVLRPRLQFVGSL